MKVGVVRAVEAALVEQGPQAQATQARQGPFDAGASTRDGLRSALMSQAREQGEQDSGACTFGPVGRMMENPSEVLSVWAQIR